MNTKEFSTGVMIILFAGAIGWSISTLIEVDKRTAIMAEKVSENHKMFFLQPEFLLPLFHNGAQ